MLDPLESTDAFDQLMSFVFGPQELQLLHTVPSIFDENLFSFLDEREPMDLTMPRHIIGPVQHFIGPVQHFIGPVQHFIDPRVKTIFGRPLFHWTCQEFPLWMTPVSIVALGWNETFSLAPC
ncbi:hypothetical protein TNCV_215811 [Trichonephila clavipes]|nr:hypothetical protein TNCV_215811 [Trichonephila clavipes]